MPQPQSASGSSPAPAGEVRSEHSGDFLRLARLWERRTHHSWVFAVVNAEPYRDGLMARLDVLMPSTHIALAPEQSPLDWLHALAKANAQDAQRVQVTFMQGWLADAAWWQQANVLRERLADVFPRLVVLWLPDAGVTEAARSAPDLWNWREAVCDFSLRPVGAAAALQTPAFSSVTGGDKARTLARLADIQAYLDQHGAGSAAAAHLLLEASLAHERLGQLTQAAASAQEALEAFNAQNNDRLAAQAKGQIADILQARGKLDEALAIRQNDQLPVYEQLGDVRSAAVTKGKIADILQARGKLDEALAIHQKDELPVYERLGDVREAAITKGKIADILEARGKLDEALAIRQNDELPVFEQLGEVREAAITKGKIADILQARGKLDEALAMWRDEALPVFERIGYAVEAKIARERMAALEVLLLRPAKGKR